MTTKQADKLIAAHGAVTVKSKAYGETFTALFIKRDRHNIYTMSGVFDRSDLDLANTAEITGGKNK